MIAHKVLVKMPGGEAAVARAIQGFDFLRAVNRNPFARHAAKPAVQQPSIPRFVVTMAPAAERPLGDAQQLRCLDLVEFTRFITA
jgi:hypothetical protein